jgi:hypothetical protein
VGCVAMLLVTRGLDLEAVAQSSLLGFVGAWERIRSAGSFSHHFSGHVSFRGGGVAKRGVLCNLFLFFVVLVLCLCTEPTWE